jgi:hypothetical protein
MEGGRPGQLVKCFTTQFCFAFSAFPSETHAESSCNNRQAFEACNGVTRESRAVGRDKLQLFTAVLSWTVRYRALARTHRDRDDLDSDLS